MRDTAVAGGNPHLKHSSETKFLLDMVCGRSGMVFRCRVEPALPFRGLGRAGGAGVGVVSGGGDVFEEAWDQVGRRGDVGCCAFFGANMPTLSFFTARQKTCFWSVPRDWA